MNIEILHLIEGAKKAKGVTVVIDVFRAFTVEAYLTSKGAEKIIPIGDINFAYNYKKENPDALLVGERHGQMCEGFDFGNSPSQIEQFDFTGKTVVHTTSAGTQGIANATNAISIPIFKYFDDLWAVSLSCDFKISIPEYMNKITAIAIMTKYKTPNM